MMHSERGDYRGEERGDDRHRCGVRLGLWWAGLLLVAVGCGAAAKNPEPLAHAVRLYNDSVRWQRFDQAAQRIPLAQRDYFLDQRDQVHEDLRIHNYEVVRVRYGPNRLQARVHVKYSWYLDSRGVVRETHAVQRWENHEGMWSVTGETRLRGTSMPGLPDPEEPDDATDETSGEASGEEPDDAAEEPASDLPDDDPGTLPAMSP